MTEDELEAQPPTRPLTSRRTGATKPPRMAKPISGALKEVPAEPPQGPQPPQPPPADPVLDFSVDDAYDGPSDDPLVEAAPVPPKAKPVRPAKPKPDQVSIPEPPRSAASDDPELPQTVRETVQVVDESWRAFHAMAARFPSERMDEHLSEDGWTRKQMLFHIAAWHDLTADRLIKFFNTGQPPEFDGDTDQFNALAARRAIGKTAGEVMNDTEATFNRLRRQIQRLSDPQLVQFDRWAAWVIRGNTYGHYEEHWQDVFSPEPPPGSARR